MSNNKTDKTPGLDDRADLPAFIAEYLQDATNGKAEASSRPTEFVSHLFFDVGNGFEEANKYTAMVQEGENKTLTVGLPNGAKAFRVQWAPVHNRCYSCQNVFLLHNGKVVYPERSSALLSFKGKDYFGRNTEGYIFTVDEVPLEEFTLHFSLAVCYAEEDVWALLHSVYLEWTTAHSDAKEASEMLAKEKQAGQLERAAQQVVYEKQKQAVAVMEERLRMVYEEMHLMKKDLMTLQAEETFAQETVLRQRDTINHLGNTLTAVYKSTSWRISAPLRALITMLRGNRAEQPAAEDGQLLSADNGLEERRIPLQDAVVSFIIPTYNAGQDLPELLTCLFSQKGLGEIEVVVVDSGSTDETPEKAEYLGAKVLRIPNEDFSHSYARNLGAKQATGDYFVFMTQDALPNGYRWAEEFLQPLADAVVVAATCAEKAKPHTELFGRVSIWGHHYRFMQLDGGNRIASLPKEKDTTSLRVNANLNDVACATLRGVFLKYLYRGEYGEDLDYGLRLIEDGYKLAFMSSVQVIHSHNRAAYYYLKRAFVENKSLLEILPETPHDVYNLQEIVGRVMYGYCELCSLQSWLESFGEEDLPIDEFEKQLWEYFYITTLFKETVLGEGLPRSTKEADLDKLLQDIWVLSVKHPPIKMGWVESMKIYVFDFILPVLYNEEVTEITAEVREDISDCMLKFFSSTVGSWLYHYYAQDPESEDAKALCDRLFGGV